MSTDLRARVHRAGLWRALVVALAVAVPIASSSAPPTADAGAKDAHAEADVAHSASLAGVSRWADAEPADLSAESTYALPGFFHADVTLENLRRRFGASNVAKATLDGAEGETIEGIVLFDADPARRAELFFADAGRSRGLETVRVRASRSRWHFDDGIHPGLSLADLVRMNGAPVSFHGLDWDYGGGVTDWHGGRLGAPLKPPLFRSISLTHAADATGYPLGEDAFRSDDPRYPKQGGVLTVGEIALTLSSGSD